MSAPAPFNPATLRAIRKGASAADLSWDEDRYLRVCRDHGIEPTRSPKLSIISDGPFADLYFDDVHGGLRRGRESVTLTTPAGIVIFGVLLAVAKRGREEWTAGENLRSNTQRCWSKSQVSRSVAAINETIKVMGLTVESRERLGYRLIKGSARED